jgi:hypothetical protein
MIDDFGKAPHGAPLVAFAFLPVAFFCVSAFA